MQSESSRMASIAGRHEKEREIKILIDYGFSNDEIVERLEVPEIAVNAYREVGEAYFEEDVRGRIIRMKLDTDYSTKEISDYFRIDIFTVKAILRSAI